MPAQRIHYKRSRFSTSLPNDLLYTAGHAWLGRDPEASGVWRVGVTKFAVRMLGDLVESDFEVAPGQGIAVGEAIGWVEGFKAVTDLFAPLDGTFAGRNEALDDDVNLLERDCYARGWLYRVEGTPGDDCLDVHGYMAELDTVIDKMIGKRHDAS